MEKKAMSKGKIAVKLLGGVSAYLATVVALGGFGNADAAVREVPSSFCHAKVDNLGANMENAGAFNNLGTTAHQIFCPVVSDSAQQAGAITSLSVLGREGTDGAWTAACSCYVAPLSCTCPSITNWVNGGSVGVVASLTGAALSEWPVAAGQRTNEYRWVLHNLTGGSTLVGYNTASP